MRLLRAWLVGLAAVSAVAMTGGRDLAVASGAAEATQARTPLRAPGSANRLWTDYKNRFVTAEGRVVDNGNRGISHSEGQGYAMVLAAAFDDRATFDRIWSWTRANLMLREDGLIAWRWDPTSQPHVQDPNNATDGDLLVAWGLAEAGLRWNRPELTEAAKKLVDALFKHTTIRTPFGLAMLPGVQGFREGDQPDGPVLNLSYWVFPAIDRLEVLTPGQDWQALRRTGYLLIRAAKFGPLRLPSEWVATQAAQLRPAQGFEGTFGYNAIRIPLYLAWSSGVRPDDLRPYASMWNVAHDIGPFVIDIASGAAGDSLSAPGYRMVIGLAACIAAGRKIPFQVFHGRNDLYYPATLHLLTLLAIGERYPQCL